LPQARHLQDRPAELLRPQPLNLQGDARDVSPDSHRETLQESNPEEVTGARNLYISLCSAVEPEWVTPMGSPVARRIVEKEHVMFDPKATPIGTPVLNFKAAPIGSPMVQCAAEKERVMLDLGVRHHASTDDVTRYFPHSSVGVRNLASPLASKTEAQRRYRTENGEMNRSQSMDMKSLGTAKERGRRVRRGHSMTLGDCDRAWRRPCMDNSRDCLSKMCLTLGSAQSTEQMLERS